MAAKVRKSEQMLDQLERSGQLSREGRNWLISAVDPFHDTLVKPEGYPDLVTGASVVQMVKQQIQISCPASITSGTWDCQIFNLPWLDDNAAVKGTFTNTADTTLYNGNATQFANPLGGLVCAVAPTTGTLDFTNATALSAISVPESYWVGPSRVISMGFEVTNTTSELYQQGSVTVFRIPQPSRGTRHSHIVMSGTQGTPGTLTGSIAAEWRVKPPGSLADAQLLPGSRVWHAKEGAYVVCTQSGEGLRDPIAEPILPIMINPADLGPGVVAPPYATVGSWLGTTAPCKPALVAIHDYNLSGAWFSGLSLQTTLTVAFNVLIERFPSQGQRDLVTLATPSPSYDPLALELYSRMIDRMPVGVMVQENGLGDWFAGTVAEAAPFIQNMLSSIPHPYAQAGATLAGAAGKLASRFLPAPGEKGDGLRRSSAAVPAKPKVKQAKKVKRMKMVLP